MSASFVLKALASASLCILVVSSPVAVPEGVVIVEHAAITPSPVLPPPSRTHAQRRDIISDVTSDVASVLSGLGSTYSSWVASGVEPYFQGLPTGDAVISSLGVQSSDLAALPTEALNIDPYANWTNSGWNVRFHGNIYKQPNTSVVDLNSLANGFLVGTNISSLPTSQQDQARNLTAEIYVVQQGNVAVAPISLYPAPTDGLEQGGIMATGGTQDVTLPYNTTAEGDFDVFLPILSNGLLDGNATTQIQRLNTFVEGTTLGNSTAYLVPPTGLTIISDIDDILRVTQIYEPALGLLNTFARPFTAWENMPDIYANWSNSIPGMHFHYLTTTPEQVTRNYMQFIYSTYPLGSFDTRPLNFSDVTETLSVRKFLLEKIFQTFPERKFILIADTSNSDVMSDYPAMVTEFPGQVQCIFLRNTTATDSGDKFPYDTSGFKNLNQSQYMFFLNPSDLTNLDIVNGQCYNQSIPQNVTFGYQGLAVSSTSAVNASATHTASAGVSTMGKDSGSRSGWMVVAVAAFVVGFMLM